MKNLKKVLALSLSLSLALPLAACGDQGETGKGGGSTGSYPSSTITVVCPWDAGGTSDGLCRIVSEIGARDEYFGVNMVVQNSGGAGGTVATTEFKNAAPDGYTLCQEAIGVFTLQPFVREVSYTIDDFIPVAALSNEPIIMIAGKDSGITSVDDLLEMDSVTYGFSGSGLPSVWLTSNTLTGRNMGISISFFSMTALPSASRMGAWVSGSRFISSIFFL